MSLLRDTALAGWAGFIGTKAMERASMKLYELESGEARGKEERVRPGPPYRVAATGWEWVGRSPIRCCDVPGSARPARGS